MNYIVHKRFKTKAICGDVNIPATTTCLSIDGVIFYKDKPICVVTSENAHNYFARNNDGNGIKRGNLTQKIIKTLTKDEYNQDSVYQERWDRIWNDPLCAKYKRKEHKDHWLWNHSFYNAPIEDLEYIYNLILKR